MANLSNTTHKPRPKSGKRVWYDRDLDNYPFQLVWNRRNITPGLLDMADREHEAVLHEIGRDVERQGL